MESFWRSEGFFCSLEVLHGGMFVSKIAAILRIQDPVIFNFFTPVSGSEIRNEFFLYLGSRIPVPGSNLWAKSQFFLLFYLFLNIVKYIAIKKTTYFFPLFFCVVGGSGIKNRDPGQTSQIPNTVFQYTVFIPLHIWWTSKLQEKSVALEKEHLEFKTIHFFTFFLFTGSFLPTWIRIQPPTK